MSKMAKGTLPALVTIGVMAVTSLYLQPLLVGGMISDRGFTEQQAGFIASADLAGMALASFIALAWLTRIGWRVAALFGLATMALANAATTAVFSAELFAVVRFVSGFGGGTLLAIAMVGIGHSEHADRNYAILLVCQLLFGTLGLWALPFLLAGFGLNGAYWLLALLAVLVTAVTAAIPTIRAREASATGTVPAQTWLACSAVLLAILLFFVEQNAVWAYSERIGNAAGLSAEYIGFSLGLANLMGLVGAALVAWLGTRFGRLLPLCVVTVVQIVCLGVLVGQMGDRTFLAGMMLLAFAWNVIIPYQLGILAEIDASGRMLALAATVTGVGLALGPGAGAMVLRGEDYSSINVLAGVLAIAILVLVLPALLQIRRKAAA